ncbi:hypothetical protein BDB00DRAFT_875698 [Zychaea mexicana]|uniref:uncharacterized protein n=1 Tax=Zychaea mexicana TaxID=64656 RepID=UPI0022FE4E31|nr:uncharacterized protein BDB00DRAFT_875698 [Zychaea mexicana]KAI9490116.1 hypothetical protein BDB00DRAFT_875698 [Zychaea mexicana]
MSFNVFSINAKKQKQPKTKTCVPCNTVIKLGDGSGNWRTHVSSSSHQANVADYDARIVRASASNAEDMDIDSTNSGEEQQQQQKQQQQQQQHCGSNNDVEDDDDSDDESVDIAALRQSYGVFLSRRQESGANAEFAADVESDGGSDDEIDEGDDDGDNPLDFSVDYETNEDWYPFENQLQFRLAAFFHADDRLKDRMIKKQLKSLLEDVAVMFREDKDLKVPSVRWMMDPSYTKRSKVPKIRITTVKAEISKPNTDETVKVTAHMHKFSNCLKLLNADPTVSSSLSALPDKRLTSESD